MSYDLYLEDEHGNTLDLSERQTEGGTIMVGGTRQAHMSVTYNYAEHYYRVLGEKGLRGLSGKKADDVLIPLAEAISKLKVGRDDDYWAPTEGNARYALEVMIRWGLEHPEGIWKIT